MEFFTAYGEKPKCDTVIEGISLTKQEFKDECDINNILKKYAYQAGLDNMAEYSQYYAQNFEDVSSAVDLQEAYNRVFEAQEAFDAMPSNIRARFANDPVQLLHFLGDASNLEEAVSLGLIQKPDGSSAHVSS